MRVGFVVFEVKFGSRSLSVEPSVEYVDPFLLIWESDCVSSFVVCFKTDFGPPSNRFILGVPPTNVARFLLGQLSPLLRYGLAYQGK